MKLATDACLGSLESISSNHRHPFLVRLHHDLIGVSLFQQADRHETPHGDLITVRASFEREASPGDVLTLVQGVVEEHQSILIGSLLLRLLSHFVT